MHQLERYTKKERDIKRKRQKQKERERERERETEKERRKTRGCITPAATPSLIVAAHSSLRVFTEKPRECRAH